MSKEYILVVDDNRQIADFVAGTLLNNMGYYTEVAYSGKAAADSVNRKRPDLMLLDFELTDTTGIELLRKLAKEGTNIPAILVTAHGSEAIAVDAFRLGVQDYLTKPVDVDTLGEAVTRALTASRMRHERDRLIVQLKEQISWLQVLARVGKSMTSVLDVDEVLKRIVEAAVHLTKAEEGFLALLDERNSQLFLRAVKNLDEAKSKTLRLPVTDTLLGNVVVNKRPLRMVRSPNENMFKVTTGYLVHSFLHVPLIARGRVLGVLSVDNRSASQPFREADETLLMSLADYAAIAIENANLYQKAQQEIAERTRVESALRESEDRYALAVRGANDGLWDWNLVTNVVYYSPRWKSMLGYSDDEIGTSPDEWFNRVHPEDRERIKLEVAAHYRGRTTHFEHEHRMMHKDGSYHWMLSRGITVRHGESEAYRMAGSQSDITARKEAEQKLLHDAFHDALTGLPNRALFMDRLRHAVERAKRRDDYNFAVLFLDLDRFKDVNDSLGHLVGDQLLVATAEILSKELRTIDTVARFGGDEFVILLEEIGGVDDATRVADRVQADISSVFRLEGHDLYMTTSIGIVLSITGYQRPEDVLRDADIAMYRAKANGKARFEIFDPSMREHVIERLALEADLRLALDRNEFYLDYQPIVNLETGKIIGFEALARWQHPMRGRVGPDEFIPMAEETNMIGALERVVLEQACNQMLIWEQMYPEMGLTMSVNMSAQQLAHGDPVSVIREVLGTSGLPAKSLKVEITESAIMENIKEMAILFNNLKSLGVQIDIDDFGVGYSSLNYLAHFPINSVKIDRSFINMMTKEDSQMKIVQAIIMLAHGLGMKVVAEGVELEEQLMHVRALGCESAQGFLLARPVSVEKVNQLLAADDPLMLVEVAIPKAA